MISILSRRHIYAVNPENAQGNLFPYDCGFFEDFFESFRAKAIGMCGVQNVTMLGPVGAFPFYIKDRDSFRISTSELKLSNI